MLAITSDVDWASEHVIAEFLGFLKSEGIRPTIFGTHNSEVLSKAQIGDEIEIGIHPNFLPNSSHGDSVVDVIDTVTRMFPEAVCSRGHSFFDSTPINFELYDRGIAYDSNLCLWMQKMIVPLRHASGITRLPVFWEDDIHWRYSENWDFDKYRDQFETDGLKIINVHPIHFALNTPNEEFYRSIVKPTNKLSSEEILEIRYSGKGVRTFITELVQSLVAEGHKFHTLGEIYEATK